MRTRDRADLSVAGDVTRVHVLVLAAGAGLRLGLGPKAHVRLGGDTFLDRVVRTCHDAALGPVRVIGRADDAHVRDACARLGAALTINPCPARGMSSSVHVGLTALAGDGPIDGVLVFPVDLPLVRASTLALVAGALGGRADAWARPVFRGESGHPVVLGSGLLPHIIAAGPAITLRDALRSSGGRQVDVECDDPGVTESIDLPDQLRAAERALAVARSTKA